MTFIVNNANYRVVHDHERVIRVLKRNEDNPGDDRLPYWHTLEKGKWHEALFSFAVSLKSYQMEFSSRKKGRGAGS